VATCVCRTLDGAGCATDSFVPFEIVAGVGRVSGPALVTISCIKISVSFDNTTGSATTCSFCVGEDRRALRGESSKVSRACRADAAATCDEFSTAGTRLVLAAPTCGVLKGELWIGGFTGIRMPVGVGSGAGSGV
jgi:hypothetical protein